MNCIKCGFPIEEGLNFCTNCGTLADGPGEESVTSEAEDSVSIEELAEDHDLSPSLEGLRQAIGAHIGHLTSDNTRSRLMYQGQGEGAKKAFDKACRAYVHLEKGEEPLVVFDNNSFYNGKEGFVMTNRFIHYRNAVTSERRIPIKDIKKISEQYNNLFIDDHKINILLIQEADTRAFLICVGEIIKLLKKAV